MSSDNKEPPECQERVLHDGHATPEPNKTPNTTLSSGEKNSNNNNTASSENEDYESEPVSLKAGLDNKRKKRMNFKDGKTMHPKVTSMSREVRELAKKQMELEKNLKIEGMPDPPKIRKRRMSVGSNIGRDRDVTYKRKRLNSLELRPRKDHLPKWGVLGGDASDPLNLNGLATSEEGRLLNLKTPENSPLPTPDFRKIVYVKVPPNIEDPLNLEGKHDQRVIDMLLNATRKKRHRSKKNKDNQTKEENLDASVDPSVSEMNKNQIEKPPEDIVISNLKTVNQTAAARSRSLSMSPDRKLKRQISGGKGVRVGLNEPKKYPENPKFTLGNYNRYYGYRNHDNEPDPRLRYFSPQWFENKDILDIGCNVGHVTLALAEQFLPKKILGMDIDGKLIGAARQNIRHMLSQRRKDSSKYPSVFELSRGPLEAHPLMGSSNSFPNNVLFLQGNYVPGSEEILQLQKEEFDTILALSITKWIHLNNGDHGLKLFFRKIHKQLRPGGRFILEPQPWSTYRKRAKLSPELFKNYSSIKLKPEGFKNYLLSIGFVKCEVIGVPVTKAKGFRRPLILFTKADPHSSVLSQQNMVGLHNGFHMCTECPSGDQADCDHIQFTGMRQGAYADRLYDHITYRSSGPVSIDPGRCYIYPSPLNFSNDNSGFKNYSPYVQGPSNFGGMVFNSFSNRSSSHNSTTSKGSERSESSSISGNGSQFQSGSERSWTNESSHSGSSQSSSSGSSSGVNPMNGMNNGPVANGIGDNAYSPELNGDVAADIHWMDNEDANMDFENMLPQLDNGDNDSDNENDHPLMNGDLANDDSDDELLLLNGVFNSDGDSDNENDPPVVNGDLANGHLSSGDEG